MNTLRAVIFDMDGLMIDSERVVREAFFAVSGEIGIAMTDEIFNSLLGTNAESSEKTMRLHYGQDFDFTDFRERKRKIVDALFQERGIPVKKGLHELIDFLKSHEVRLAVASSTRRAQAQPLLEQIGVFGRLDAAVFGDEVGRSKPEPDIFLKALELLCIEGGEVVVLEDSFNGIRAAYRAGIAAVMVPDILQPTNEIAKLCLSIQPGLYEVKEYLRSKFFYQK